MNLAISSADGVRSGPLSGNLRGRPLRYLLTTILQEAERPLTVGQLVEACAREGVVFDGRPSKVISDSLRWERRRGRVARLGRGVYRFDSAPRSTRRWIRVRVAKIRTRLQRECQPGGPAASLHTEPT